MNVYDIIYVIQGMDVKIVVTVLVVIAFAMLIFKVLANIAKVVIVLALVYFLATSIMGDTMRFVVSVQNGQMVVDVPYNKFVLDKSTLEDISIILKENKAILRVGNISVPIPLKLAKDIEKYKKEVYNAD